MPGVSNHSSASPPSMRRRAPSTWRVVPGSATSPKRVSRVSVRSSEVLPVLVCPTTAMRIRESAMSGLQPVQRVGGCRQHGLRGQAQRRARHSGARRTILVRGQQQPDARLLRVRGQFGDQRERAPVRRLAGVAGDQEARGGGVGQRVEDAAAFLARVEPAGDLDAGGVVAGGQGRSVGSSSASSTGRPSSPAGAGADRRGSCSGSTGRSRPVETTAGSSRSRVAQPRGRCAGRRACAAARPGTAARRPAGAARHRPPPRRSAIATIAPGRRPARSGRRRWRAPWRRRAAGSPPGPAASRSPGSARRRCPARAAWWPR